MTSQRRLLMICRRPPYGSSLAREALDMALAAGAFEQNVALYFTGDGVWQLLPEQHTDTIEQKSLAGIISALPLYDIETIYVNQQSLSERGLDLEQLATRCEAITPGGFPALSQQFDVVLNF